MLLILPCAGGSGVSGAFPAGPGRVYAALLVLSGTVAAITGQAAGRHAPHCLASAAQKTTHREWARRNRHASR
jgi:hypothetical protein